MRIACQQTILMIYYALIFVIFEKNNKIWNCRLLQIKGGALRAKKSYMLRNTHLCSPLYSHLILRDDWNKKIKRYDHL